MPGQSLSSKFLGSFELHGSHHHLTTGIVIYGKKLRRKKSSPEQRRWREKKFKAWSNIWIIFVAAPATKIETNPRMFSDATCFFLEKIKMSPFFTVFCEIKKSSKQTFWQGIGERRKIIALYIIQQLLRSHTHVPTHSSITHPCSETRVQYIHTHALTPMLILPYI